MKRKEFLGLSLPFFTISSAMASPLHVGRILEAESVHTPPYLEDGDTIGITSPAGYISLDDIQPAKKKLEEWGFRVRVGKTIGRRDHSFGGTDKERQEDLQQMLDDRTLKAVMFARGGYGAVRIIDKTGFFNLCKTSQMADRL